MTTSEQLRVLPVGDLIVASDRRYDQRIDDGLVASIREHGLLQPILVQPDGLGRFEVLAGRRRLRHAIVAGLAEIPVLVRGTSGGLERLMVEAEENAHRAAWSPMELADLCRELTQVHKWTQEQVSEWMSGLLGRKVPRSQVSQYLQLLEMTAEAREALACGEFSFSWGRELARLNGTPELQRHLVTELQRELAAPDAEVSARAIRRRVDKLLEPEVLLAADQREASAKATERVYSREVEAPVTATEAPAPRNDIPTSGDPLVGLYLDQVREGLRYLVGHAIPEDLQDVVKEVAILARQLEEGHESGGL